MSCSMYPCPYNVPAQAADEMVCMSAITAVRVLLKVRWKSNDPAKTFCARVAHREPKTKLSHKTYTLELYSASI